MMTNDRSHINTTPENLPQVPLGNCKIGTELKIFREKRKMERNYCVLNNVCSRGCG